MNVARRDAVGSLATMTGGEDCWSRGRAALCVFGLLLVAAWLRLQGLDWDEGQHLHPDERFLTMVETAISLPHSVAEYFDTAASALNPANRGHKFFVYGTVPLFLVRALGERLGLVDYGNVHLLGRVLSALFDLGTVWLGYAIGRLIAGRRVGVFACALAAFSVISIQNAHFFTVDSTAAFFAALSLLMLLRVAGGGGMPWHVAYGVALGLALGCRINLALLLAVHPLALLYAWRVRRIGLARLCLGGALSGLACALVFRIVQPYAFAGPGFFGVALAPDFLRSMKEVRSLVTGAVDYPPSVQWIGRTPILFAARNLLVWGIGPAWGLAVLAGMVWCGLRRTREGEQAGLGRIVLVWALVLFGYQAWQFAAAGRYFLPIVPALALAVAWPLGVGFGRGGGARGDRRGARGVGLEWGGGALFVLVLGLTAIWAVAFTAIYRRPVSRVEASRWIYGNIPAGSTIAVEHWDDGLPLGIRGAPPISYKHVELELYAEDDAQKRRRLIDRLADSDYVVLSSNRLYRSIPRAPWRYPLSRRYYELLFSGDLGFRLERSFTSYPRLGPFEIPDDDAEEVFTVYDHPHVLIFKKTDEFSRENVERLLGAVRLDSIVRVSPRAAGALYRRTRPTDIPLPGQEGLRTAVGAGFAWRGGGAPETSLGALLRWLATFEVLSVASFAMLFSLMAGAVDRGFGLGKLVAWLGPGYAAWLVCSFGIAANTGETVRAIGGVLALAGLACGFLQRREWRAFWGKGAADLIAIEAVFLVAFGLVLFTRSLNPAIYWGEKPMDFAIVNAIVRSRTMPPVDPWFAGGTLNYFYFGHALAAFFAKLAGVSTAFAFNLAIATIGGLTAVAAFLAGRRIGGRVLCGLLSAFAVTLLGNLDGVRLLVALPGRPINFDYFWATSRVIEGTINEFPAWNLLFADLHAHVMAQPLEVALIYLGALWIAGSEREPRPSRLLVGALVAWLLGAVAVTSAWSMPATAALQLAFLVTAWRRSRNWSGLLAAVAGWLLIVLASRALYWPFWSSYRSPVGRSWGFETSMAPLGDVVTIFGIFVLALIPALLDGATRRLRRPWSLAVLLGGLLAVGLAAWLRSPAAGLFTALLLLGASAWWWDDSVAGQIGGLLVAAAGGIGLGTEIVFLWDRMNTVFKYYLELWLLLACAAGSLGPAAFRAAGRARMVWTAALLLAALAGSFTTVSGAIGLLRSPFVPSDVPTLDGMQYLTKTRPDELAAFRWLDREVAGVPVLLEAQGPSYQEFGRVSMNTGLPTVLGWEYHLFQQARSQRELDERKEDVRTLFSTTDLAVAERLMRKYHVDLVFVGGLERRTYPAAGLAKFAAWPITQPVFRGGAVTIYATPGILREGKTWVEEVHTAASAAGEAPAIALPFGSFREPRDIARAPDGTLLVADFGNRRIQRVAADLKPLGGFGEGGDAPGQFRDPCGVAVGMNGDIYVADTWNHRIQKLSPTGEPLAEWAAGFYGPRGVAIGSGGGAIVADTGNNRVVRLGPDGAVAAEWGRTPGDGALSAPVGIAVDQRGEIYVADVGHHRVAVFSDDGTFQRAWPVDGWKPGALLEPYLDVGPDGVVWVTDPSENRVLLFDPSGQLLGVGSSPTSLAVPLGIAVLDATHAAVSNAGNHSLAIVSFTSKTSLVPE